MPRWILACVAVVLLGAAAPSPTAPCVVAPSKAHSAPQAAPEPAKTDSDSRQSLSTYERESLTVDRAANRIAERANLISEAQRSYSFWQLLLGAFGVGFTGLAAFWAWRAAHWAKGAANAATTQLKALKDGERAYLSLAHPLETVEGSGDLLIGVTNSGRTAATTTEVAIALLEELPETPDVPADEFIRLASNFNIPAGAQGNITDLTKPNEKFKYLLGWVRYVDVYGRPHQTNFRYTRGAGGGWYGTGGHAWHAAT